MCAECHLATRGSAPPNSTSSPSPAPTPTPAINQSFDAVNNFVPPLKANDASNNSLEWSGKKLTEKKLCFMCTLDHHSAPCREKYKFYKPHEVRALLFNKVAVPVRTKALAAGSGNFG